jgi:hypothetical protein
MWESAKSRQYILQFSGKKKRITLTWVKFGSLCSYGSSQVRQDIPEIMNCCENLTFVSLFRLYATCVTATAVWWSEFLVTERRCIVSCEIRTEFIYVM